MDLPEIWPAPAKVNLFLHITGRRDDGYHTLQSVFQFLDLCDELQLAVRPDGEIRRLSGLAGVAPEDDLTVKAARRLKAATGTRLGAEITVHKRIPLGGGLGGGSSDAATTLVALNHLWRLGLSRPALAQYGLDLGADVPVFVHGRAAWAEGVGERLTAVELDRPWYVVVHPGCEVSTAEVFSAPTLTRDTPPMTIPARLSGGGAGADAGAVDDLLRRAGNDCEAVVRSRYPQVDDALQWLERHGRARMTGTGACVFLAAATERDAEAIVRQLPGRWQGFVARGMNRSPLLDRDTRRGDAG